MKQRIALILLSLSVISSPLFASTIKAEDAQKEIIGEWKLLSYKDRKGVKTNYDQRNVIWSFDGQRYSVESDDLAGRYTDSYRILRSKFSFTNTVIMLSEALRETHLDYGKFVIESIVDNKLTLTDWDEEIEYLLIKQS